jgi:hypothetical protein
MPSASALQCSAVVSNECLLSGSLVSAANVAHSDAFARYVTVSPSVLSRGKRVIVGSPIPKIYASTTSPHPRSDNERYFGNELRERHTGKTSQGCPTDGHSSNRETERVLGVIK